MNRKEQGGAEIESVPHPIRYPRRARRLGKELPNRVVPTGHIDAHDVGAAAAAAAAYLLSDEAANVTATTLYVDSGYHAMGMSSAARAKDR